ncbi:MAG: efflux RND transporter periplasmic adaptor subunit [Phenylobacterium sp.]|uniref:efflux RND transporter periplasmic adaptor subunit n=1 Tax=Phenylobacterium sp. TaxID=1871053 RepID=UPI00391C8924
MTRSSLLSSSAAMAAVMLLAACGGGTEEAAEPPPPAVEAAAVRPAGGLDRVTATGALQRQREAQLSFRVPGVITQLSVEEGDLVRKGQLIARIDPTAVEAGRQQALASLEQARRNYARDQTLFEQGFVSRQRLDDRKSALEAAEAAYAAAAFDRRWATLAAPSDGVVLSRPAAPGQVVQPGQAVVVVADAASPLVLRAPVPDQDAARLQTGASATVRIGERELQGRIIQIGGQAGRATGTVNVDIQIPPGPGLRSGQVASAEISAPAEGGTDFARVPAEAIQEAQNGRAYVLRLDKGVARRTEVAFGGFEGDDALVRGLPADARVITAGGGFVGDGDKVQVVDPQALIAQAQDAGS